MILAEATPTVTAGAYSTGDAVGGIMEFKGAKEYGLIHNVFIFDSSNQQKDLDLVLFSATPTTPTADNAAFAIAAGDNAKVVGVIPITTHKALDGDSSASYANGLSLPFKANATTGILYGQLVSRTSAPTYTSTSALRVQLSLLKGADAE
jgi:hypothetical protein